MVLPFHFFAMRAPKTAAAAAPAAPDTVALRCEDLGETREFTPAHAERLLAYQEQLGHAGDGSWQPVAAPADSKD